MEQKKAAKKAVAVTKENNMEIAKLENGEGKLDLKFENGEVKFLVSYEGKQANGGVYVNLSVDSYLDLLKKAIPGTIDDTVIDLLKVAMKSK